MTPCVSANVNVASGTGDRPVPAAFGRQRAGHQGLRPRERDAAAPLGLRRHHAQLRRRRWAPAGTRSSSAARSGSNTTWDLIRDGVVIVNDWAANTGTAAVTRVQIGDTAAKTFTVNFDHVRVDLVPGEGGGRGDTQGPTTPGTPTGTSPSNGTIQISWSGIHRCLAADHLPGLPRRQPDLDRSTTSTSFTDPGLTPGTSHTYTVDAVDSLNNPSLMSGTSASITVIGPRRHPGSDDPGHTDRLEPVHRHDPDPVDAHRPMRRRRSPTGSTATATRPRSDRRPRSRSWIRG